MLPDALRHLPKNSKSLQTPKTESVFLWSANSRAPDGPKAKNTNKKWKVREAPSTVQFESIQEVNVEINCVALKIKREVRFSIYRITALSAASFGISY